jgi:hypothetical protein
MNTKSWMFSKIASKAEKLVDSYRIILMNEDTECGDEILCTVIAKQCSLIAVDEVIQAMDNVMFPNPFKQYWNKVKQEILAL